MTRQSNKVNRPQTYACPCCGYKTLPEEPPGTYFICPVCFWEDDAVQVGDPQDDGGANQVSLVKAKENFKKYGAVEERFRKEVRRPKAEELK